MKLPPAYHAIPEMTFKETVYFMLGKNMIEINKKHIWSWNTLKSGHQVEANILQKEKKKQTAEELDYTRVFHQTPRFPAFSIWEINYRSKATSSKLLHFLEIFQN